MMMTDQEPKKGEHITSENNLGMYMLTVLDCLDGLPRVNGDELDVLLQQFHDAAESTAQSSEKQQRLFQLLQEINPHFVPGVYSEFGPANVLANVVAALYAPIIHNFNSFVLKNIQKGLLSPHVIAPPRDTIPFVTSLQALADQAGIPISIYTPAINRNTAGVANNQKAGPVAEHELLRPMLQQTFAHLPEGTDFTEIEPGIYSTLSPTTAQILKEMNYGSLTALKLYGLGPNLSYIHGVLSLGQEFVADAAEKQQQVSAEFIAQLMILLDSIEEFGMQNEYQSVTDLTVDEEGVIVPIINYNSPADQEIARATNQAVLDTAAVYNHHDPLFVQYLLSQVPMLAKLSQTEQLPITLSSIIPPDDKEVKLQHFQAIAKGGLLNYPSQLVL